MFKKKQKFHYLDTAHSAGSRRDKKPEVKWWSFKLEDVFERVGSSENGLEDEEIKKRQKQYGLNELPKKEKEGILDILVNQVKSSLAVVLIVAALISVILGDFIDAGIILLAVIINIMVGFWQEWKTSKTLEALEKVVVTKAKVLRAGREKLIKTQELVPGDVVLLSAGDKVPADVRLFKIHDLKINEALLTGEAEPREKDAKSLSADTVLAERINLAFMGTLVGQGNARGIVVETAKSTALGRIAELVAGVKEEATPLQKKLNKFALFLTKLIVVIAVLIFVLGLIFGHALREMFVTAVAIAVAAIPEGLAVTVTVVLAIGMQRILKHKAIVKRLLSAEVLGSTNVICVDKTGTLTEGKMQVVKIVTEDNHIDLVSEISEEAAEERMYSLQIGMLCNNAYIAQKSEKMEVDNLVGSLTEKALLLAGINFGLDKEKMDKNYKRLDEVPFNPSYKFMMTLHRFNNENNIIYLKGAPEKVLLFSNYVYSHKMNDNLELNSYRREKIIKNYEGMSKQGLRVLAVGYKKVDKNINSISNQIKKEGGEPQIRQAMSESYTNFVFVGLVGIKDPIREDVVETVQQTKQAGINTVMITGDNRFTARVIAKESGLKVKDENILEGDELATMNETELKNKVKNIKIYARATPEDKLKIVRAWQETGAVVAMTGDGINDAPALKQASIGVALGTATDVAKEAADIILLDNNFKTIVRAVRQGRIIFANIKKIILYYLSDSLTEMIIILLALIFKWPLPILASQIIWVNLIDDTFPALALTQDPPTHDMMKDKPVKIGTSVLNNESRLLVGFISLIGALLIIITFYIFWQGNEENFSLANTIGFSLLATSTLIYAFGIRDLEKPVWKINIFSNKLFLLSIAIGASLQFLAVYNPFLQKILQTKALNFWHWLYILGIGLFIMALVEFIKWLFYKKRDKR